MLTGAVTSTTPTGMDRRDAGITLRIVQIATGTKRLTMELCHVAQCGHQRHRFPHQPVGPRTWLNVSASKTEVVASGRTPGTALPSVHGPINVESQDAQILG